MSPLARHAFRWLPVLACLPARAALPTVSAAAPAAAGNASSLLQAGFGMLLVLGLIFLLAWLARRFGVQRLGASSAISVISSAAVGTRERVVVVQVAGTWLVLGVTSAQVNVLHTLPAQTIPGPSPGGTAPAGGMVALFQTRLREAMGRGPAA